MPVQFGVFVPQGWRLDLVHIADPIAQYEAMTRAAQTADALPAYDSIWVFDHFHTHPTPEMETTFECWTTSAALARDTQRVNVGQMVSCNGYRNPALFAKMASTVDVLSHGRLYCGLGAGWYEHEWRAYGYDFPETRDRMRAFREACEIVHRMWTEETPTVEGEYYRIHEPINEPKGVRKPHPSFWIGGGGEQVTLKLVAQWGDACNVAGTPETLAHKFAVLREHCEAVGRPYEAITRSSGLGVYLINPGDDPDAATRHARGPLSYETFRQYVMIAPADDVIATIQEYIAVGVNYVLVYLPGIAYDVAQLHRFAEEVVPHCQGSLA